MVLGTSTRNDNLINYNVREAIDNIFNHEMAEKIAKYKLDFWKVNGVLLLRKLIEYLQMNSTDPGVKRSASDDKALTRRYKLVRKELDVLVKKYPQAKDLLERLA